MTSVNFNASIIAHSTGMTINTNTTLLEITEQYPDTVERLVEMGFRRMADPQMRARFASSITVEAAALARGMQPNELLAGLGFSSDGTVQRSNVGSGAPAPSARHTPRSRPVEIAGLVPCPIRVPMTNVLEQASLEFTAATGMDVEYDLKAAYMGTEWMEENLGDNPNVDELPDIFLSAGFRLFFTDPRFVALRSNGAFADRSGWDGVNAFARENDLQDPERRFTVIGVVPAVFMVNREHLNGRTMPKTWEDVLTPEFENSLALPVGDFDLFDSLLIGIHRRFGMAGVERLARNMFQQMHPAQMVASASHQEEAPAITVMPYFFTRTINESSPLVAVWPTDGALAAPILLITRADRPEIQPLIDTIAGIPMSRVMSRMGLFPSTHPENDDFTGDDHPLQWPGWDALLSPDLPRLLADTARAFDAVIQERAAASTADEAVAQ